MKKIKIWLMILAIVAGVLVPARVVMADAWNQMNCSVGDNCPTTDGMTVIDKVGPVIDVAIGLAGLLAVVMIIYAGFLIATSAGDFGKVQKGKNTLAWAVIGLIVAILAFAIVNFVLNKGEVSSDSSESVPLTSEEEEEEYETYSLYVKELKEYYNVEVQKDTIKGIDNCEKYVCVTEKDGTIYEYDLSNLPSYGADAHLRLEKGKLFVVF